jgi:hypothetical protein
MPHAVLAAMKMLLLCGGTSGAGACEYNEQGFNRTWFFPNPAKEQLPGDYLHAIYAASYEPTGSVFPLAWSPKDQGVQGVDVTQRYIDTEVLMAPAVAAQ